MDHAARSRHDIHSLITRLDFDVLDMIEAVSERIALFRVRGSNPLANKLGEGLAQSAVRRLRKPWRSFRTVAKIVGRKFSEAAVEVNRLENEADDLYRKALGELFNPAAGTETRTFSRSSSGARFSSISRTPPTRARTSQTSLKASCSRAPDADADEQR